MEANKFCSPIFHPLPLPSGNRHCHRMTFKQEQRRRGGKVFAAKRDFYKSGRLVDVSMIYLRKRMNEMKMIERNYEPPAEWMEWEKQYYTCYDDYICKAVGLLQSYLMNTRPCLALGILALVFLSVPTSISMVFIRLLELAVIGGSSIIHPT